ncbi:MAG: hypothetical protein HGA85_03790 [Nanoarchaeota archaeon]|nr:hypothetical protein [Nanoarchaeota archaeon]
MRPIVYSDIRYHLDSHLERHPGGFHIYDLEESLSPAIAGLEEYEEPGQDIFEESFAAAREYYRERGIVEKHGFFKVPDCLFRQYDLFEAIRDLLSDKAGVMRDSTWVSMPGQVLGFNILAEFSIRFETYEKWTLLGKRRCPLETMAGLWEHIGAQGVVGARKIGLDDGLLRVHRDVFAGGKLAEDAVYITTNPQYGRHFAQSMEMGF